MALLRLPVISAIGHESDRTLIDDVAAVSCSTPTHAAEALVRVDVGAARSELQARTAATSRAAGAAIARRAQRLGECSRAPTRALRSERARLHQLLREARAAAGRGLDGRRGLALTHATVVARKGGAFAAADAAARRQLTTAERAVNAHDPQRTLERGYALVADRAGEPVASAAAARERERVVIRFADDAVGAEVDADGSDEQPR